MANNKVMAQSISRFNFNFKLGKTSLAVLGIGVFAIIIVVLMLYRNQQVMEQKRLRDDLVVAQNRLSALGLDQLDSQYATLSAQVNDVNNQLEEMKNLVAIPETSIKTDEKLFTIARESGVEITIVSTAESYPGNLNGIACMVLPASVSLRGELLELNDYVNRIRNEYLTCFIDDIAFDVSVDSQAAPFTATLNLLIYTYRGN